MTIEDTSNSSNAHFSEEELAELAALEKADTTQLPSDDTTEPQAPAQPAPASDATPAATAPPDTPAATPAPPADPAAHEDRSQGDIRNALRAARRSERQAREEAARLARENEELRKQTPAPAAETSSLDGYTPEQLEEMKQDFPVQYALLMEVNKLKAAQPAQAAPAAPKEPEFEPPVLPAELQDAVDQVPEVLAMQIDPDRTRWNMAVAADALLINSPKWADKPAAERLVEVARMVRDQVGEPSPQPKPKGEPTPEELAVIARQRIADAARTTPLSISDIRGGASPSTHTTPDYSKMTDEEILASVPG